MDYDAILQLKSQGLGVNTIAVKMRCSSETVYKALGEAWDQQSSPMLEPKKLVGITIAVLKLEASVLPIDLHQIISP